MTVDRPPSQQELPRAQALAEKAFSALEHFIHIEAVSGIVLLAAAGIALLWANSPAAESYHALWHAPLSVGVGPYLVSQSLHFWVNDALMTIFFLVVGMEIRREIHEGALANLQLATLPMAAALGGVIAPALLYLTLNTAMPERGGWAIPTATDIAFAVGVLALLGKAIPGNVRVFLLALAIIDDIVAVLIIAVAFSAGLDYSGLLIAGAGILMVLGLQWIGVGSAYAYVIPGGILWWGMLRTGAHPTLAGVVLGMMTPVLPGRTRERPLDTATQALHDLRARARGPAPQAEDLAAPLKQLRQAQREVLPPVTRVQMALHPWVAYLIMPLFALANAGVSLDGVDLGMGSAPSVLLGVAVALIVGKPLGVVSVSWCAVRLGWCKLPPGVTWGGVCLIGLLAGIGFTMSIFIATLAFSDANLLGAAKLGVLLASALAAVSGLIWGFIYARRLKPETEEGAGESGATTAD
ncbi:Na+/H+ antiporter NhaA [Cupriavidus oxalaticus]|uniref:Na(+)/H(+) antiporter NhaA n=1 Tax=Cupriavidus oxalaticus TaxID=96344 RepID=A0A375GM17_9BURK|nr:Na+/H+ antiporter NhaA [Cupriavidus oxalaticus]QRQ85576.1 Na+/H+ antiporter NhaA [Cupriavidus oxalaticus]QRQ90336.1 Na+/H+ antiporter NhaA [Cupriavidus oxalaticus]WQD84848.1 Na+/H+ antiporter NhaA [Cupriavidus oxalaticus]SPC07759.1 Na(+)/H(+) antiporter NhaA [Cupriavidus oxalaticus]SPC24408.1 Na(+)/H(+) antiporter NhaA [Cupriavidus oxalaticus]